MRCASGIGTWAAKFIQAPPIPSNVSLGVEPLTFGNTHLDHVIAALSTVLKPTRYSVYHPLIIYYYAQMFSLYKQIMLCSFSHDLVA